MVAGGSNRPTASLRRAGGGATTRGRQHRAAPGPAATSPDLEFASKANAGSDVEVQPTGAAEDLQFALGASPNGNLRPESPAKDFMAAISGAPEPVSGLVPHKPGPLPLEGHRLHLPAGFPCSRASGRRLDVGFAGGGAEGGNASTPGAVPKPPARGITKPDPSPAPSAAGLVPRNTGKVGDVVKDFPIESRPPGGAREDAGKLVNNPKVQEPRSGAGVFRPARPTIGGQQQPAGVGRENVTEDGQRSTPENTNDARNGRCTLGGAGLPSGGTVFAGDELEPNRELEPGHPPLSGSGRREARE